MITLSAPAKLNLFLHVMGKRADGYHLLDSLVTFLPDMCDIITIEGADRLYFSACGLVPKGAEGNDNLVVKAVKAMAERVGREPNVRIRLEKAIPSGAGLGGGSSDAAAVIKGLEQFWDLPLGVMERREILLSLGADVPVCYHARPCRFEGIGEVLSGVPPLPHFTMLLIWPDVHTATKDVFTRREQKYRQARASLPLSFNDLFALTDFLKSTSNDLQEAAEEISPPIHTARAFLEAREGCLLARMSGSGSCIFGIFESRDLCSAAQAAVHEKFPVWWTHLAVV